MRNRYHIDVFGRFVVITDRETNTEIVKHALLGDEQVAEMRRIVRFANRYVDRPENDPEPPKMCARFLESGDRAKNHGDDFLADMIEELSCDVAMLRNWGRRRWFAQQDAEQPRQLVGWQAMLFHIYREAQTTMNAAAQARRDRFGIAAATDYWAVVWRMAEARAIWAEHHLTGKYRSDFVDHVRREARRLKREFGKIVAMGEGLL